MKKTAVSVLFHCFDAAADFLYGGAVQFGAVAAGGTAAELFPFFFNGF